MAEEVAIPSQDYVNQTVGRADGPGFNRPAPGAQAVRAPRIYVKVRYYVGALTTLTFYIPTKDGVVKERVIVSDQQWPTEIINYLKTKGKHRTVTVWFYSSLTHMRVKAKNDAWTAKIPAKKLLNMIKSTKTWTRSGHASKLVELLEQLLQGGGS